jgi:hypothetical protein
MPAGACASWRAGQTQQQEGVCDLAHLPSSRKASARGRSCTRATSGSASTSRRGSLKSGSPRALHVRVEGEPA